MKDIFLFNSLSKQKEVFTPLNQKEVGLYSCGPTVYNYLHIGNLRAYIFADTLKRVLQYNGYKVKHIMNVTDIGHLTNDSDDGEDKMLKALKREGKPMTIEGLREVANFYFEKFKEDFSRMNIVPPEKFTFASDYIPEQVALIEDLLKKGFAYKTSDGIYFDTEKLPTYGRLGGSHSEDHSRIGINTEKKNPRDFALWKFADIDGVGFESSLGKGFPGWHIECSAMSMKYLGEQFDIHTGGIDNAVPHHNNEIAQCEASTGKILANYFMHNNHITIKDGKMGKSEGNFITLNTLIEQGISPLAYRYWLLTSRYSTRMDFSEEAIKGAETALNKLRATWATYSWDGKVNENYKLKLTEAINDDLDSSKAIAILWELIKDTSVPNEDKKATLSDFDKVLGIEIDNYEVQTVKVPPEVEELANKRKEAKKVKNYDLADQLRTEIKSLGFDVVDDKDGNYIFVKN